MKTPLRARLSWMTEPPFVLSLLVAIALSLMVYGVWHWVHSSKQLPVADLKKNSAPEVPKPYQLPDFLVAGVHKTEGIENPLIRQLTADPARAGYTGKNNAVAIKKWVGREVHIRAVRAGLIGRKFGEEIRVKAADQVAVVFQNDEKGNLIIVQYTAAALAAATAAQKLATATASPLTGGTTKDGFLLTKEIVYPVAPTIAASHFVGPQDGTTILSPPYSQHLFMYVG